LSGESVENIALKAALHPVEPRDGFIQVPEEPGFGMNIKPEAWNHPAAARQVSGR
jgi:L-alanine-DL-glutamate epimerase-like enolase superfamily enzyme